MMQVSPLAKALTVPVTWMGVSLNYLGIVSVCVLSAFILFKSFFALLLWIPLHVIGVALCAVDHHIFDLILAYMRTLDASHKRIWGCQCYEPY